MSDGFTGFPAEQYALRVNCFHSTGVFVEFPKEDLDTPLIAPRTQIEEELARLWSELLSLDAVGIHDNFFDQGGHSLAATRVVSQVIKRFQLEIPLESSLAAPTIAEMATVVTEHVGKEIGEAGLDRILAELESLTEIEARRLLANECGSTTGGDRHD